MIIVSKLYGCSCSHVSRKDDLRGTVDPLISILRSTAVLLLTLGVPTLTAGQSNTPPNVLFIAIDDMNDWTSYLQGHPQARTPNLDRLAQDSVRFTQAYCNAPSCNPSRASVMLGKHPNSTGFYSNKIGHTSIDLRKYYPDKLTIPQFFKQHGYSTFRTGKIYHYWGDWSDMQVKQKDLSFDVHSWGGGKSIEPSTYLCGIDFGWSFTKGEKRSYMDWGAIDAASSKFGEYGRASTAIKEIKREHTKPFFAALGFYLPHLPWYYPQEILDEPELAHIRDAGDVILPKVLADPPGRDLSDLSNVAVKIASGGLRPRSLDGSRTYKNWHDAITGEDKWKEAVQAYLASIYFVDQQLGRVLDALEESPNGEHTIIVLWSDHGWMLGEKGAWRKYRPWEDSVKTNFIIKAPGIPALAIDQPVELLSIWPTLTDLAGLPMKDDLDARSLVPLMKNPDMQWDFPVITAHLDESGNGGWQSIRTAKYRYIKYLKTGAEELYDHSNDPNEWTNVIDHSAYRTVREELSALVPDEMTVLGSWDAPGDAVTEHNQRQTYLYRD
jgi:arylsulfatase A-like enzyme